MASRAGLRPALALPLLLALVTSGCSQEGSSGSVGGKQTPTGLLLAQSPFRGGKPADATVAVLQPPADPKVSSDWTAEFIEDPSNSVFHKAMWYAPPSGKPGILTIGATKGKDNARLKLWRKVGDAWQGTVIWEGGFGGGQDRLRDMEFGDVDGDGDRELVVVTHDQGVVLVFDEVGDGLEVRPEVDRMDGMWIHEVEIGDVDGDGLNEIFCTPSEPNQMKGEEQPGDIKMLRWDGSNFAGTVLESLKTRHAKEILTYDLDQDGRPELYSALEGENIGAQGGATTVIKRWTWAGKGAEPVMEEIMPLPGKLCRFLNGGDTDGDGNHEIVASTKDDGIYSIFQKNGKWEKREIASGRITSGFEHATVLLDWDGDGCDDIFAAMDSKRTSPGVIRRFQFDKDTQDYQRQDLWTVPADSVFTWNIMPMGPAK